MQPHLVLLIHDAARSRRLADCFRAQGWHVDLLDSMAWPGAAEVSRRDFVVVEVDGPEDPCLTALPRPRQDHVVGLLVLAPRIEGVFAAALEAGADMVLPASMPVELLAQAVRCICVRADLDADIWHLDAEHGMLIAPDGAQILLSRADLLVVVRLLQAEGGPVSREELARLLDLDLSDPNALHAAIYRLRRRIQRATAVAVPLQSRSRQGYAFRARLLKSRP